MKNLLRVFIAASLVVSAGLLVSGCKDEENPTDPGLGAGGGITSPAFPNNTATLAPGGVAVQGTLSGGTPPYTIKTAPDIAVATAELSGANMDVLTITPVAIGTTSVTIEDASTANNDSPSGIEAIINIVVQEGGGGTSGYAGSGTLTLTTSIQNFSASGTYDENAASGQGVGGLRSSFGDEPTAYDRLDIIAYVARSVSDADVVFLSYQQETALVQGTFPLVPAGGPYGSVAFGFGVNLANPEASIYVATTGNSGLSAIAQTTAAGNNISGSALNVQNPTQTATFNSGTFNATGIGQGDAPFGRTELERAVMNFYLQWRAKQDAR